MNTESLESTLQVENMKNSYSFATIKRTHLIFMGVKTIGNILCKGAIMEFLHEMTISRVVIWRYFGWFEIKPIQLETFVINQNKWRFQKFVCEIL